MILILLGPPGAGKGTLSNLIGQSYNIPKLSTGVLIRDEIRAKTKFGKYAQKLIDAGKYIPDDKITEVLFEELKKEEYKNGVILDGYPRTIEQAKTLEKKKLEIDAVLSLEVSKETVLDRLAGRRSCAKCKSIYHIKYLPPKKEMICDKCGNELYQRADQKPEAVKQRLIEYEKKTKPLIGFYLKRDILLKIDASESPQDILRNVLVLLKSKYPT